MPKPNQKCQAPRIVTVCPKGQPATKAKHNGKRMRRLKAIIRAILHQGWERLDAVLFPGGYLFLERRISKHDFAERVRRLEKHSFAAAIKSASRLLSKHHPGAVLVLGLDSTRKRNGKSADQITIALCGGKIVAVAPKIFPTDGDTTNRNYRIAPNVADYVSDKRYVDLPSGHRALLNTCYDTFGVADGADNLGIRAKLIRWLYRRKAGTQRVKSRSEIEACLRDWRGSLRRNQPTVVLTAIHVFKAPGRDGYWQRHGISAASAALNGALSVGAAHFRRIPSGQIKSSLADSRVPATYLRKGTRRPLRARDLTSGIVDEESLGRTAIRLTSY